jgi:hypothetical protein
MGLCGNNYEGIHISLIKLLNTSLQAARSQCSTLCNIYFFFNNVSWSSIPNSVRLRTPTRVRVIRDYSTFNAHQSLTCVVAVDIICGDITCSTKVNCCFLLFQWLVNLCENFLLPRLFKFYFEHLVPDCIISSSYCVLLYYLYFITSCLFSACM